MLNLIDTHCHLNDPAFQQDLCETITRAQESGVSAFILPGIDIDSNLKALEISEQYNSCRVAVGIHPNTIILWSKEIESFLFKTAQHPMTVAIGETGLDYFRDAVSPEEQKQRLLFHLELASTFDLPLIIHNRNSTQDLLAILRTWHNKLPDTKFIKRFPGILHAFSGSDEIFQFALDSGFFLGIGGTLTYPRNEDQFKKVTRSIDNLVLETDSPVLAPQGKRGTRNEPCNLPFILLLISRNLEIEPTLLAAKTTYNARNVFRLK